MTASPESEPGEHPPKNTRVSLKVLAVCGLLLSVIVAVGLSYYASTAPDGLESVAEQVGFADTATESDTAGSPLADYEAAGVDDSRAATGLAGLAGVAVTAALAFGLFWVLRRRDRP
ncbi:hypothetical protein BH23ACT6_BH23ACT6_04130 [soil metagenome]